MALRGFRDMDAGALETFAGTAKRASQRILFSEATRRLDRAYVAEDVGKAFLQGMTHEEMQEQGEAPREVKLHTATRQRGHSTTGARLRKV